MIKCVVQYINPLSHSEKGNKCFLGRLCRGLCLCLKLRHEWVHCNRRSMSQVEEVLEQSQSEAWNRGQALQRS